MTRDSQALIAERADYAYQLFMLFLCGYAVISVAVVTLATLPIEMEQFLRYVDWAVCVLFLVDFFRSLIRAKDRWRYFYTWGWIDLLSSIPMIDAFRIGRLARVLRIIRVLRAMRAAKVLVAYFVKHRVNSALYSILIVSFSMIVLSALAILNFELGAEGANIRSAEDALWWAITTITTVGYGDRFPVTSEGRLIAAVLMTTGVGLFGTLSGTVAAWFVTPDRKNAGEPDDIGC